MMAKASPIRWPRALAASLFPHGDDLLLLVALFSILSILTRELSRHSALAADFEGFDADELDDADDNSHHFPSSYLSPPPTSLFESSFPESHHGSPPPSSLIIPPFEPKPSSPLDFWDEDEFEGIPDIPSPGPTPVSASSASDSDSLPSDPAVTSKTSPTPPATLRSYSIEIACIAFLVCFVINYFTGRRQNETIALSWAAKFATKNSIVDKNFSLLGTGDGNDTPLLLKEGQDVFKFYASGRRYCQGLMATMELRSRHDVISRMLDLVFPKKDTITFEVIMNEDAMDHVVLAVARKKLVKAMHKEVRDLQRFATLVTAPPAGRKWVADELMVVSESKEVAGDLITEAVLDQVFGEKAFEKFGRWFISLHFSDQQPGSHKKILTFKFVLPDVNNMADMTRLVTLVPYYIDLIGRYKLSSHVRSKTEAARAKAAQEAYKELQNARQEALQKRKAEKRKMMEEAEAKLSAEALSKKEERERARKMKKSTPRIKMHHS